MLINPGLKKSRVVASRKIFMASLIHDDVHSRKEAIGMYQVSSVWKLQREQMLFNRDSKTEKVLNSFLTWKNSSFNTKVNSCFMIFQAVGGGPHYSFWKACTFATYPK